ncbi:peptidylprolyl isomerase [Geomesophilobacter sediminis]|uniref:peptidylprolyl isomerase n=1 Tax=Geomesophilobacter sediminis TaxID=2798584 RepID=A0A8J7S7A7_9BACT|nr:peptidyl-prolyl cis-trans isomerase [Geomesophilobacter sediminis]MBJ6726926.1 peptidyl-prolyl cis-trans isomerase [Geomesophilobacter sediminis]
MRCESRGVIATLLLTCLLAGCQEAKKAPAQGNAEGVKVLAKVNGVPITDQDVAFRISKTHGMAGEDVSRTLDDVIKEELLYQKGMQLGLGNDPGYRTQIEKLERQLANLKRIEMTRRVFNTQITSKIDVTSQEVKAYYDRNAEKVGTELHLGMVTFTTRQAAEEALQKVRSGASFETVASTVPLPGAHSAPIAAKPWDIGYTAWDQIPFDFVDAVYRLRPGEVSGVLSMKETGFYLFKRYEARKNAHSDLESVAGTIRNRLREQKVAEAYRQFEEQLKREAKIEKL